jgi:hypothetical protein
MKKFLGLSAVVFLFSMCSTELDLLDDWKETTVVYGLLDKTQPQQFIRIQKAFLGPNNAYDMAQQYDSINYVNQLDVRIERLQNQTVQATIVLQPDTFYDKQPGDFYAPKYVIYSSPVNDPFFMDGYTYRLVINNASTGNTVTATTKMVGAFQISAPNFGSIGFASNNVNYKVEIKWQSAANAVTYQLVMVMHYTEELFNSTVRQRQTQGWTIGTIGSSATTESIKFEPDAFYRFVAGQVAPNDSVVERRCDSVKFYVYAAGEELHDYMRINGPSSSLAQERPQYTNIENGLGVFSGRTSTERAYVITNQSLDSLSRGRFTCGLKFLDHNGDNWGCQ